MLLTPASVVANTPNADVAAIAETDITVAAARAANFFIFIINYPFLKYDLYIGFIFLFILSIFPQKVKYAYAKHTVFYYNWKTLSVVLLFS